ERLAWAPRGDTGGRLPRARALEDVPHVVEPVLHDAGEIGVAWAWTGELFPRVGLALDRHQVPVLLLPLRVLDRDGDGAAERAPVVAEDEARAAPADRDEPEVPVEGLTLRDREHRAVHLHLGLGAALEDVEEHDRVAAHRGALPASRCGRGGARRPGWRRGP